MYRYELEITFGNGETKYEYVWADNGKDAQEIGEMLFPDALLVDVM